MVIPLLLKSLRSLKTFCREKKWLFYVIHKLLHMASFACTYNMTKASVRHFGLLQLTSLKAPAFFPVFLHHKELKFFESHLIQSRRIESNAHDNDIMHAKIYSKSSQLRKSESSGRMARQFTHLMRVPSFRRYLNRRCQYVHHSHEIAWMSVVYACDTDEIVRRHKYIHKLNLFLLGTINVWHLHIAHVSFAQFKLPLQ